MFEAIEMSDCTKVRISDHTKDLYAHSVIFYNAGVIFDNYQIRIQIIL